MKKILGLGLITSGITHFVQPKLFAKLYQWAPTNLRSRAIYAGGAVESLLGLKLLRGRKAKDADSAKEA